MWWTYGKSMENLRNRIDQELKCNENDYMKWTWKRSYVSQKIFDNELVAIRKSKVTLTLASICWQMLASKPAYAGMSILDLSKVLMYEFHYDYIKNKYGNNSRPI